MFGANQGKTRKRRRLSAEARARIAAAQKKRWAKQKRAAKKEVASNPHPGLSALWASRRFADSAVNP